MREIVTTPAADERRRPAHVSAWPRGALIAAALVVLGVAALVWMATGLGAWLVVEDPLAHARAVVVLGGQVPFRPMEAAAIYRQGWAPEVWITRARQDAEQAALRELKIEVPTEEVYSRAVLEKLGVPSASIQVLSQPAENTAEEVRVIARELQQVGGGEVILVTSKPHSRRVRATWRALIGDSPHAIVRYATADPYDPHRWWRQTGDALAVSREFFGLLNVWAGFPVRTGRR
jgi:uncharacterized SAM-binding protein YcdF (DUF218 family)